MGDGSGDQGYPVLVRLVGRVQLITPVPVPVFQLVYLSDEILIDGFSGDERFQDSLAGI